jgi:hypothetical protein
LLESPDVSDRLLAAGTDLALETFDFTTAHKLADRRRAIGPVACTARAQLARVLTAEGDAVAAIAVAQEAAALEPDTERFAYADTLMRLDRIDEARQELESLRNDASIRDEADLRLGKLAYLMGDMAEAGRRFGSLIGSQSAAPEAFFYLSSIAEREGRTDLALEGFSKLAEAGAGLVVRGARPACCSSATSAPRHSACSTSTRRRNGRNFSTWNSPRPRCSTIPDAARRPLPCCSWRSSGSPIIRACATRLRSSRIKPAWSANRCAVSRAC